ncbi:hypothetical protein GOODEAATRI_008162 [Goodea atripinnis]|uniref:Ribosome biogenesis protein NOP53 n=1 Tax=Goodea atripinnis TaxID=208336 RepID=A0ABV0PCF3_9TELE
MSARRRLKRVAASQPGFLTLKSSLDPTDLVASRRKRVNKNKKKNWNKYSDINDVEEFLEDVRLQERTTGILAYQQPNAKKLRRIAQNAERLAAKGVVPRRQKQLLSRRPVDRTAKKAETNNNPDRHYYDIWGQELEQITFLFHVAKVSADPWYLQQTGKKLVKEAHEVEVQKKKQEDKLERQLAVNKEDKATEFFYRLTLLVIFFSNRIQEQQRLTNRRQTEQQQQLFQLRSIKASIRQREQKTKSKQMQRKSKQEAQKAQPRRLGKLKYIILIL